jgi:hypothetical protein
MMAMTKAEFGALLKLKLEQTNEIVELSRWAYKIFNENSRGIEPDLKTILLDLARMEDAPEFEYSYVELVALAQSLTNSSTTS